MKLLGEIINAQVVEREIPNRKTGEIEKLNTLVIHVIDKDYPEEMRKVVVWKDYDQIVSQLQKGAEIEIIFRTLRSANQYEKLEQISAQQENIRIVKTALEAIKEMQARLSKAS